MDLRLYFQPVLAMVVLTALVWLRLYFERIPQMKRLRVHPQAVASSAAMAAKVPDTRAADNFRNLFELPILFYVAMGGAAITSLNSRWFMAAAWLFVLLRVVHSAIHCSYNKVMHRFAVYVAGAMVLWAMWLRLGWHLLAG
jgi:hypothetical protein